MRLEILPDFSLLAHTAYREAEVAIHHILGIPDEMSYKAIPAVVYTNPELASVGKTEEELVANWGKFPCSKDPDDLFRTFRRREREW